ncbi:MAG: aspartate dehydrogenase [Dehalococcoidia bacterium]|nr:aspartate dehydrogenase [Dehalococcoidia bacterium]
MTDSAQLDERVGIGLLGCGTMGSEIALAVVNRSVKNARIVAVFDEDAAQAARLADTLDPTPIACRTVAEMLAVQDISLVVECAAPAAVAAHGETVLAAGRSLFTLSSGAFTDTALLDRMTTLAARNGCDIVVPSGALGGIDALRSVRDQLDEVTLTSTKPPRAFSGAPGFAKWEELQITEPTVLYEGPARDAVPLFPANVNVAATLSIAGIGPERTIVKVVADPASPGNVHEIHASGAFGEFTFRLINQPHVRNPRTSHLAVLSAIETLRAYCERGPRIGT